MWNYESMHKKYPNWTADRKHTKCLFNIYWLLDNPSHVDRVWSNLLL